MIVAADRIARFFLFQFVIFKPLSYCFEETIGFDVKVSFASRPVSCLIKPCDITRKNNFINYFFIILRKCYSVPQDVSWIENYKLNT